MNNEEQKLIEDLFSRLYKTETDFPKRDLHAEKLIRDLLDKYPNSSYYMTQTIFVQETAIKKLNNKISELERSISLKDQTIKSKPSSFLSGLFKSKNKSSEVDNNSERLSKNNYRSGTISGNESMTMDSRNDVVTNRNSSLSSSSSVPGFLSGALQTAAGVAGGMVMANVLMNLFQNKKPEEEIIDQISYNDVTTPISSFDFDELNNNVHNDSLHNQDVLDNSNVEENHIDYEKDDTLNQDGFEDNNYDDNVNDFDDDNLI